ncbi:MAG: hypothetical protein AAGN64_01020 [Bacteroidota bacterium]
MREYLLGIDPGVRTGIAVVSGGELVRCFALELLPQSAKPGALLWLLQHARHFGAAVIEDATALGIYARHRRLNREERDAVARSVGEVDLATKLLTAILEAEGVLVLREPPQRRKKWDAARLEELTGWTHPTCHHARDAARLIVGESVHTVRRRLASQRSSVTASRQPATVS